MNATPASDLRRRFPKWSKAFDVGATAPYDLVYEHPPVNGWEAWLLGDGSGGATVWMPPNGVKVQLGHTNLIDRGENARRETGGPAPRHALQAGVELNGVPLFDAHFLQRFHARLSLGESVLSVEGESLFGEFNLTAYWVERPTVFVLEYADRCTEKVDRRVRLERIGSRTLSRFWTHIAADPTLGLTRTDVRAEGNDLVVSSSADRFAVLSAARLDVSDGEFTWSVYGYGGTAELGRSRSCRFRLLVTVVPNDASEEAARDAIRVLAEADSHGREGLAATHREQRRAHLSPGYVHLPRDPYYAQLWHLARYYLQSSSRGAMLPFFINGPWGWNRDVRAWPECWFHWNFHGVYIGALGQGEWAALEPYIAWCRRHLGAGRALAQSEYGCDGAALIDQRSPDGDYPDDLSEANRLYLVAGLQEAHHFYVLWKHTGDEDFLREALYPFAVEVVAFWRSYLQPGDDGRLHVPRSVPYEFGGGYAFRDCLTDLAHLRALLPAFAEMERALGEESELGRWAERSAALLAPFQPVKVPGEWVTRSDGSGARVYDNPFFDGQPYREDDKVLAIGISEKTGTWVSHTETHFRRDVAPSGVFCSSQTAHVYPAGLVTSDASPEWAERTHAAPDARAQWEMARNALRTIRRYPHEEDRPDRTQVAEEKIAWTGHSLEMPAFARLGLSAELRKAMDFYIDRYQMFPQGMWNYHPRKRWLMFASFPRSVGSDRKLRIEHNIWSFHFGLEPLGIFSETVNLMLLDSSGGLIRPFPAYEETASFRLPAWDGFWVSAGQIDAELEWVIVESALGRTCRIRVPWDDVRVESGGEALELEANAGVVSFSTERGAWYFVTRAGNGAPRMDETLPDGNPESACPKAHQSAALGIFRRM